MDLFADIFFESDNDDGSDSEIQQALEVSYHDGPNDAPLILSKRQTNHVFLGRI